jgi:hypothetical protein
MGIALGMLAILSGCQIEQRKPGPEPLDTAEISVDPAMQNRDWPQTPALYQNDTVLAWPDYTPLRAKPTPIYEAWVWEPALFIADTCYIPGGVFVDFPWKMVEYKSLSTPPSPTAMPPLMPSSEDTLEKENRW